MGRVPHQFRSTEEPRRGQVQGLGCNVSDIGVGFARDADGRQGTLPHGFYPSAHAMRDNRQSILPIGRKTLGSLLYQKYFQPMLGTSPRVTFGSYEEKWLTRR